MKTNEIGKAVSRRDRFYFVVAAVVLCSYSLFPSRVILEAGPAVLFTAYFWLFPDSLRSRSGSLVPAYGLAGFLWLGAAFICLTSFF